MDINIMKREKMGVGEQKELQKGKKKKKKCLGSDCCSVVRGTEAFRLQSCESIPLQRSLYMTMAAADILIQSHERC
jgi:hypothetical protein